MNSSNVDFTYEWTPTSIQKNKLTAGERLFEDSPGRNLDSIVLKGEIGGEKISLTLSQLRGIVSLLHDDLHEKGIYKGTTIMLVNLPGTSDLYNAIYYVSLITMGVRVFMPMQYNLGKMQELVASTEMQYAIIPGKELLSFDRYDPEQRLLLEMNDILIYNHVSLLDTISSFPLHRIIQSGEYKTMTGKGGFHQSYKDIMPDDIAIILATWDANGNANLVKYSQVDLIRQNILVDLPISTQFLPMEADVHSTHRSFHPYR
jgi:hypothetical protein